MAGRKKDNGRTVIYKTLHRRLKNDHTTRTPLKTRGEFWKDKYTSCYCCYNPCDKSWMSKGPECGYVKRNITVVIC